MSTNPTVTDGLSAAEQSDLEHYMTIPWTRALLTQGGQTVIPCRGRRVKSSGESSFFAKTLAAPGTFPRFLCFHGPLATAPASGGKKMLTELHSLLRMEGDLNGFPDTLHGGVVGTLFDESMGLVLAYNMHRGLINVPDQEFQGEEGAAGFAVFTGELTTRFLAAIKTPQDVLLTAAVDKVVGRKFFTTASMRDQNGKVLATGRAVWIAAKLPASKL
jgi:acyl-coenzyme A thioesterase PaaI-like protein